MPKPPVTGVGRDVMIVLRVTRGEKRLIDKRAKDLGLGRSEYVRRVTIREASQRGDGDVG